VFDGMKEKLKAEAKAAKSLKKSFHRGACRMQGPPTTKLVLVTW